ncbi:protein cab-1-like isoform X2 [Artemia franciscana]|uniref:protein cab-1-like isoform X2 n=1 Tax=Artemia franciscana TaxID=6661 RepID=UPI0032DB3C73
MSLEISDEDYYVDQLPKYLSPNRHFRPPSREEDPWYRQGNAAFKNSIPQIYLRPHSRLVEELESEDDLIAQLAAPFEKQLLRNVVKVQDLENSKHRIMDPNHDRRRVENMPPRIHLPSDDDQIVPGPKVNNQGKFGYLPSDPQFSEPDRDTSKEGVDDMKKLVNDKNNRKEDSIPSKLTSKSEASFAATENTKAVDPTTETRINKVKKPENDEIAEGYFQKHNIQSLNGISSEPPLLLKMNEQGNSSNTSHTGEPVAHPHVQVGGEATKNPLYDFYFTVLVAGCTAALVAALIAAGMCWVRLQRGVKAAADVDYPAAYRGSSTNSSVTTPGSHDRSFAESRASTNSSKSGDRKLAQSAHMFHYQHQKQQVLAMERNGDSRHGSASGVESDDDNEEGDYTVYECPGLAPTGEMEVKNPMFLDDSVPPTPTSKEVFLNTN